MKVLIIDNTLDHDSWGAEEILKLLRTHTACTTWVRRAPEEDLPLAPDAFDRIILTGSRQSCREAPTWVQKLDDFLHQAMQQKIPLFGICFGHQTLIRVAGGLPLVRKSQQGEWGWTPIELLQTGRLFQGMPKKFFSFSSHEEEVSRLPPQWTCLAQSEHCGIQAFEHPTDPIYGVQFHPERTLAGAQASLLSMQKKKRAHQFLNANRMKDCYNPDIGRILIENFLKG